jgi:hypothetical protein
MYSGATDFGKKLLMDALNQDPDLSIAQKAIKNFKNAGLMKEKAGEVFKAGKYVEAIEMFD